MPMPACAIKTDSPAVSGAKGEAGSLLAFEVGLVARHASRLKALDCVFAGPIGSRHEKEPTEHIPQLI